MRIGGVALLTAVWQGLWTGVQAVPPGFLDEGFAKVKQATGFAFAPKPTGGHMLLLASKSGYLWVVPDPDNSDERHEILDISSRVCFSGERGLQGVVAHPDFLENRWIYVYYPWAKYGNCGESADDGPVNRLSRFTMMDNNQVDVDSEKVLLETSSLADDIHNGGDMAFGKDGNLYVTIGDSGNRKDKVSQKLDMLLGSMIRITDDGKIPDGNPFTNKNGYPSARCAKDGVPPKDSPQGTVCEEIYAYGLRNPFRMTLDPNTPGNQVKIYWNDVGGGKWEETNHLKAGKNYGWPIYEGPCFLNSATDCPQDDDYEDPLYWYEHTPSGGAAVGITFIPQGIWPASYNDKLLSADFVFGEIYLLEQDLMNSCRDCTPPRPTWSNTTFHKFERPVQLTFGPYKDTQALYYTTRGSGFNNVRRIRYLGGENEAPVAALSADRTSGPEGVTINFDGTSSTDPNGDQLEFKWDFGDDSQVVTGPQRVSHQYPFAGEYMVSLTVTDPGKMVNTVYLQITVGSKPVVTMISPAEGDKFAVGDIFTLIGSAVDGNGNAMQDGALTWEVRQHHNTHFHPFLDSTNGNFIALHGAPPPEDFEAATNSYLEVILTATDTSGVYGQMSRIIQPKKVTLNFDSSPIRGFKLILDDFTLTTPVEVVSWENHQLRVEAPDQGPWIWSDWSSGKDQSHVIDVPATSGGLYTANFVTGTRAPKTPEPTPAPIPAPTPLPTRLGSPTKLPTNPTTIPTAAPTLQATPSPVESVTGVSPDASDTTATPGKSSDKVTFEQVSKYAFPAVGVVVGLVIGLMLRRPELKSRAAEDFLEQAPEPSQIH